MFVIKQGSIVHASFDRTVNCSSVCVCVCVCVCVFVCVSFVYFLRTVPIISGSPVLGPLAPGFATPLGGGLDRLGTPLTTGSMVPLCGGCCGAGAGSAGGGHPQ